MAFNSDGRLEKIYPSKAASRTKNFLSFNTLFFITIQFFASAKQFMQWLENYQASRAIQAAA